MNRRGFLQAILAAGVAPYISTVSGVLMPIRQRLWTPDDLVIETEWLPPFADASDPLGQCSYATARTVFRGQTYSVLHRVSYYGNARDVADEAKEFAKWNLREILVANGAHDYLPMRCST